MESNDTEKSDPATTKATPMMVTYFTVRKDKSKFVGDPIHLTVKVTEPIDVWHARMDSDPLWNCIIEFATPIW